MKDFAKAACLIVIGVIMLLQLMPRGDASDADDASASALLHGPADGKVATPAIGIGRVEEAPSSWSTFAQTCASYDPVVHPEQVQDILAYASESTGTPIDVLFAIWQKETKNVGGAGRMSGNCPVMPELALRDAHAGTHHAEAMLKMAKVFGWDRQYGERLETMTCSPPARDKVTGRRRGFGGSCGPFQFSGGEIADKYAIPLHLDPMTFCGGALIAGWELKDHYDDCVKRKRVEPGYRAWRCAIKRYYGYDEKGLYYGGALKYLTEYRKWYERDRKEPGFLQKQLANLPGTRYSVRYLRRLRAQSSEVASD